MSIAVATISEATTTTGGNAFGRICRKMISAFDIPIARHACTYSRSRWARTSLRTSRATDGHETTAIAAVTVTSEGWKIATTTTASTNDGIVRKKSVTAISTLSTSPPK